MMKQFDKDISWISVKPFPARVSVSTRCVWCESDHRRVCAICGNGKCPACDRCFNCTGH